MKRKMDVKVKPPANLSRVVTRNTSAAHKMLLETSRDDEVMCKPTIHNDKRRGGDKKISNPRKSITQTPETQTQHKQHSIRPLQFTQHRPQTQPKPPQCPEEIIRPIRKSKRHAERTEEQSHRHIRSGWIKRPSQWTQRLHHEEQRPQQEQRSVKSRDTLNPPTKWQKKFIAMIYHVQEQEQLVTKAPAPLQNPRTPTDNLTKPAEESLEYTQKSSKNHGRLTKMLPETIKNQVHLTQNPQHSTKKLAHLEENESYRSQKSQNTQKSAHPKKSIPSMQTSNHHQEPPRTRQKQRHIESLEHLRQRHKQPTQMQVHHAGKYEVPENGKPRGETPFPQDMIQTLESVLKGAARKLPMPPAEAEADEKMPVPYRKRAEQPQKRSERLRQRSEHLQQRPKYSENRPEHSKSTLQHLQVKPEHLQQRSEHSEQRLTYIQKKHNDLQNRQENSQRKPNFPQKRARDSANIAEPHEKVRQGIGAKVQELLQEGQKPSRHEKLDHTNKRYGHSEKTAQSPQHTQHKTKPLQPMQQTSQYTQHTQHKPKPPQQTQHRPKPPQPIPHKQQSLHTQKLKGQKQRKPGECVSLQQTERPEYIHRTKHIQKQTDPQNRAKRKKPKHPIMQTTYLKEKTAHPMYEKRNTQENITESTRTAKHKATLSAATKMCQPEMTRYSGEERRSPKIGSNHEVKKDIEIMLQILNDLTKPAAERVQVTKTTDERAERTNNTKEETGLATKRVKKHENKVKRDKERPTEIKEREEIPVEAEEITVMEREPEPTEKLIRTVVMGKESEPREEFEERKEQLISSKETIPMTEGNKHALRGKLMRPKEKFIGPKEIINVTEGRPKKKLNRPKEKIFVAEMDEPEPDEKSMGARETCNRHKEVIYMTEEDEPQSKESKEQSEKVNTKNKVKPTTYLYKGNANELDKENTDNLGDKKISHVEGSREYFPVTMKKTRKSKDITNAHEAKTQIENKNMKARKPPKQRQQEHVSPEQSEDKRERTMQSYKLHSKYKNTMRSPSTTTEPTRQEIPPSPVHIVTDEGSENPYSPISTLSPTESQALDLPTLETFDLDSESICVNETLHGCPGEEPFSSEDIDEEADSPTPGSVKVDLTASEMGEGTNSQLTDKVPVVMSQHSSSLQQNSIDYVLDMSWFRMYQHFGKKNRLQEIYKRFEAVQHQLNRQADKLEQTVAIMLNSKNLICQVKNLFQLKETEELTLKTVLDEEEENNKCCDELSKQMKEFCKERRKLLSEMELMQRETHLTRQEKFRLDARKCYQQFKPTPRQAHKGEYLSRYERDLSLKMCKKNEAIESNLRERIILEKNYNEALAKKKELRSTIKTIYGKIREIKKHLQKLQGFYKSNSNAKLNIRKMKKLREHAMRLQERACRIKTLTDTLQKLPADRQYHIPTLVAALTKAERKILSWAVTNQSQHQEAKKEQQDVLGKYQLAATDMWKVSNSKPRYKPQKTSTESWTVEPRDAVPRYIVIRVTRNEMWTVTDNKGKRSLKWLGGGKPV